MFCRFRRIPSDGRRPEGIAAKIACAGRCRHTPHRGCPMRPLCRRRIGLDDGLALAPYRIQCLLIENRRLDGKVRQTHVATLGAIDGIMLPAFWGGIDPTLVAKLQGPRWHQRSVKARIRFWQAINAKLSSLGERIDAAIDTKIRLAIHSRIPLPTADDIESLELWEHEDGADRWRSASGDTRAMIELHDKLIEGAQRRRAELQAMEVVEREHLEEHLAALARFQGHGNR